MREVRRRKLEQLALVGARALVEHNKGFPSLNRQTQSSPRAKNFCEYFENFAFSFL
jgi:hypothetical protein